jgi:hypothetical protein
MYLLIKQFELKIPDYYGKGNCNNCLFCLEFPYGTANGYEKRFIFTLLHPKGFCWPYVNKYNGHARFQFGCGLFTISFDWLNKKSIKFV